MDSEKCVEISGVDYYDGVVYSLENTVMIISCMHDCFIKE